VIQQCCGEDCVEAGASRRDTIQSFSGTISSMVLTDVDGNIVVPHSVGDKRGSLLDVFLEDHGINETSALVTRSGYGAPVYKLGYNSSPRQKRDCDEDAIFNKDGDIFTKTGKNLSTYLSR
jgi:hypothetical protein